MNIKQLSIFVENKPGRAYAVVDTLSKNNINISALSISESSEYGIMRVISDDPENAKVLLRNSGVMVKITDVIAIPMGHKPGELSKLLKILTDSDISVEYMYAFVNKANNGAVLITKTNDNDKAVETLKLSEIIPLTESELF